MKKTYKKIAFLIAILFSVFNPNLSAQTVVEKNGQLHVDGNKIKNEHDEIVQFKGMSFFWHQWDESYAYMNEEVMAWLKNDWKIQLVRAPIGVRVDDCTVLGTKPFSDPNVDCGAPDSASNGKEWGYQTARSAIRAAISQGLYIVIDWHTHDIHLEEAKEFFSTMAQEFGEYPNVAYEIFNEPTGSSWTDLDETWPDIKAYALEIIATIRQHDPDNIIIVGTPFYSQFVDQAADDPITVDSNGDPATNIAYTLHVYAGTHKAETRAKADYALDKGLALWMTEFGRTGTNFGPENNLDPAEAAIWEKWMDDNHISWTKWSLGIKNEVSSSLQPTASIHGGWKEADLRPEGIWNRNHFREILCENCGGIKVSGTENFVITEGMEKDFTLVLESKPGKDVILNMTSDMPDQVNVTPSLTFTGSNWNVPQNVTVSGIQEEEDDGNQEVTVTVAVDKASDSTYQTLKNITVKVTMIDNDEPVVTGLEDGEESKVIVFPNPVSGNNLTVSLKNINQEKVTIHLFDNTGKLITRLQPVENQVEIPSQLINASGVYFLRIENRGAVETFRIVVRQ